MKWNLFTLWHGVIHQFFFVVIVIFFWSCQTAVKTDSTHSNPTGMDSQQEDPVAHPVVEAPPPPNDPKPVVILRGDGEGPQQHVWQPLTDMIEEAPGYGMYTYVLFGRKLKPRGRLSQETLARYERLLHAIHLSTLSVAESGITEADEKQETNLFLIPMTSDTDEPTQHNYHGALSLRTLAVASRMVRQKSPPLAERLTTGEGPFLISTLAPMGHLGSDNFTLLHADLSSTNPAAMAEIVGAYKRRVAGGIGGGGIERFRSLRIALLDLILDADDNIKIVKSALAQD